MDIDQHLNSLKVNWDRLNLINDDDYKIPIRQFKVLIALSLPRTGMPHIFTESYVRGQGGNRN